MESDPKATDYARNLVRRAFDRAGERILTKTQIVRYVQNRVNSPNLKATLDAMTLSGELGGKWGPPIGRGRPTAVYYRAQVIPALDEAPRDNIRTRPSGAAQRKHATLRATISAANDAAKQMAESTEEMRAGRQELSRQIDRLIAALDRMTGYTE